MGLFDKLFGKKEINVPEDHGLPEPKNTLKMPEAEVPPKPKKKATAKKKKPELTPKEKANLEGEPYVNILSMDIDPADINSGAFELDWNDKFVLNLIRAGFKIREDDTENQIVDRWFQTVCRNVALELYEQQQADPDNRYRADLRNVRTKDIGDGRTEVS